MELKIPLDCLNAGFARQDIESVKFSACPHHVAASHILLPQHGVESCTICTVIILPAERNWRQQPEQEMTSVHRH